MPCVFKFFEVFYKLKKIILSVTYIPHWFEMKPALRVFCIFGMCNVNGYAIFFFLRKLYYESKNNSLLELVCKKITQQVAVYYVLLRLEQYTSTNKTLFFADKIHCEIFLFTFPDFLTLRNFFLLCNNNLSMNTTKTLIFSWRIQ